LVEEARAALARLEPARYAYCLRSLVPRFTFKKLACCTAVSNDCNLRPFRRGAPGPL
jgi:hypothetical protein